MRVAEDIGNIKFLASYSMLVRLVCFYFRWCLASIGNDCLFFWEMPADRVCDIIGGAESFIEAFVCSRAADV